MVIRYLRKKNENIIIWPRKNSVEELPTGSAAPFFNKEIDIPVQYTPLMSSDYIY